MSVPLYIDGLLIPIEACEGLTQDIQPIKRGTGRRLADWSLNYRTTGSKKYQTVISGGGWVSVGLDGVDFTQPVTVKCIKPLPVHSDTTSITLPTNRRVDVTPIFHAKVGDGLVETPLIDITNDVATVESVAGASGYRAECWIDLVLLGATFTERVNQETGKYGWSISGEEQ